MRPLNSTQVNSFFSFLFRFKTNLINVKLFFCSISRVNIPIKDGIHANGSETINEAPSIFICSDRLRRFSLRGKIVSRMG